MKRDEEYRRQRKKGEKAVYRAVWLIKLVWKLTLDVVTFVGAILGAVIHNAGGYDSKNGLILIGVAALIAGIAAGVSVSLGAGAAAAAVTAVALVASGIYGEHIQETMNDEQEV